VICGSTPVAGVRNSGTDSDGSRCCLGTRRPTLERNVNIRCVDVECGCTLTQGYLTIDDAPTDDLPSKLSVLNDLGISAVLFCEGRRMEEYPDHCVRAITTGIHLGNHTYSHHHASDISVDTFAREVGRTEELIEETYERSSVSRPAKLFRFPYGDKGGENAGEFQRVLREQGFRPPDPDLITYECYDNHAEDSDWYWTVDVRDWEVNTREEFDEQIASMEKRLREPSPDIILFHDNHNSSEILEYCLTELRDVGVEFGPPTELL